MSGACIRARIDIGAAGAIHSVLEGDVYRGSRWCRVRVWSVKVVSGQALLRS